MNKRSIKIAVFLYIILILSFLQVRPGNAQDEVAVPTPLPTASPMPALASGTDIIVPDWRDITTDPFNLQPAGGISNPVLTKSDITDVEASFVADPFLYREGSNWYMFFEVFEHPTQRGRIGLARSPDGYNWTYDRIVLSEDFHLSYPYVFSYNGKYYMIPETYNVYQIRLYEAQNFPYDWVHVATLREGHYWVDTSIFYYDNTWWMFSTDTSRMTGFLYYSDNLTSGWVEHPRSPYILNDSSKASPGGRAFVYNGNRIIRIVQKDDVSYGEQVRAFQVDVLTKTDYAESEISESPLLVPSGTGWNADGMHHYDPWWDGDNWIAVVDGINDGTWSIGIYEATNTSSPNGVIDSPATDLTITVGQSVLFSGSATDPDNNVPFSYRWQFGEGSGIPDATVEDPGSVQFNTAGTYKVTFSVTDANALTDPSPATRTIVVLSENATPTPLPGATETPLPPPLPTATLPPGPTPTVIPGVDHSLWNDSVVPSTSWVNEPYAIEVGVKIIPAVDGYITGIRFYKGSGNTGPHIGNLWTITGERLASAPFTNETASGWQSVTFPTPVAVSANTTYVASYFSSQGNFAVDRFYFDTSYVNYPLTAPSSDLVGGNGVYLYSSDGGFPQQSYVSSNYWVDVLFRMNQPEPTATEVPPPPPTNTPLPPPPPTATEVPPPSPTNTPLPPPPPTATEVPPPPPTNTPLPPPPPTATEVPPPPPTNTPLPPPPPTATEVPPPPPTNTPLPPPPPTATEVPPPPPTNTPTPTLVATSAPDLIFADGFESGDLQNWSSSIVDGGDLVVDAGAALVGNYGARFVIDDNNPLYLVDETPASTTTYQARFYFDPNTISMVSGNSHYIFYGYSGTTVAMRLEFRFYSGMYQLRTALVNDSTSWTTSNWFTITDSAHFIEMRWAAATAPKTRNGYLTLWIDGIQRANLSRMDNDTRRIDRIRLGPVTGIDNGTRGVYFFDAFESRTQTYIGN